MSAFVDFGEVKAQHSIMDVCALLGIQTKPEADGIHHRGDCPFCGEKRGFRITINAGTDKRGMAGCFKCGPKGDAIGLAAKKLGMKANAAALYIMEHLGGEERNTIPGGTISTPRKSTVQPKEAEPASDALTKIAGRLLHEHPSVQALGISPENAQALGIGYDKRGMMQGRVLIPLYYAGRLVGFAGFAEDKVPLLKLPPNFELTEEADQTNIVRFPKASA